jgi:hypothetical protein
LLIHCGRKVFWLTLPSCGCLFWLSCHSMCVGRICVCLLPNRIINFNLTSIYSMKLEEQNYIIKWWNEMIDCSKVSMFVCMSINRSTCYVFLNLLWSLYSWRFPLPYCSNKDSSGPGLSMEKLPETKVSM